MAVKETVQAKTWLCLHLPQSSIHSWASRPQPAPACSYPCNRSW